MPTRRQTQRLGTLKTSLTMQLDDDGKLMIKCAPMFKRELRKILREIEDEARELVRRNHGAPDKDGTKRTGRLRRSIHAGDITQVHPRRISGTVSAGSRLAPYARYVHEGTKPGVRTVRRPGSYFAFEWHGRTGRVMETWAGEGLDESVVKGSRGVKVVPLTYTRGPLKGQQKTYSGWTTGPIKNKKVAVKSINHPGYKGDKFLNAAAIKVVRRYGGTVKRRDGSIIER